MTEIKRARVIYNPTSGREELKKKLPDIMQRMEQAGFETSCHATTCEGDATLAAQLAVSRKFDLVIAAGGDGTIYEVINGLAEQPNRPRLGIIPAGTTNDFARALRIPKNMEKACELIAQQKYRAIDVGKMNDSYFINIAGGGSMTELTYEVPSRLKTMLGQLAYYMKGLEKLPRLKPFNIQFKTKEGSFAERIMLFLICNSNSVGGLEKLAPYADLSDGKFDVIILKKCSLPDFVKIATQAQRGEHLDDPHVVHFQTDYIEIASEDYTQLNMDGEFGGTLPCTFSMLPRHIEICMDETGKSKY